MMAAFWPPVNIVVKLPAVGTAVSRLLTLSKNRLLILSLHACIRSIELLIREHSFSHH